MKNLNKLKIFEKRLENKLQNIKNINVITPKEKEILLEDKTKELAKEYHNKLFNDKLIDFIEKEKNINFIANNLSNLHPENQITIIKIIQDKSRKADEIEQTKKLKKNLDNCNKIKQFKKKERNKTSLKEAQEQVNNEDEFLIDEKDKDKDKPISVTIKNPESLEYSKLSLLIKNAIKI